MVQIIYTKLFIHRPLKSDRPDLLFEEEVSESDADKDSDIIQISQDVNVLTLLPQQFLETKNIQNAMADHEQERLDNEELQDIPDMYISSQYQQHDRSDIQIGLVHVNPKILEEILVGLCIEKKSAKWLTYLVEDFYNKGLRNQKQIDTMTPYKMDVISNVFFSYKKKNLFKPKDLKSHKVKVLCKLFGRKREIHADQPTNTNQLILRKMTLEAIKDVEYPTNVLAVAKANVYHALEFQKWKQNATVPMSIKLPKSKTIHDAYSYPEYVSERRQVECKLIDLTHILTNIRTHICGKGYKFIGKDAFLKVSERDNNVLNRAYVTELVDGDTEQAEFVGLV